MISAKHVAEAELPRQLRPQDSETRAPLPSMHISGGAQANGNFVVYADNRRHEVPLRRGMTAEQIALAINAKLGAEIAFAGPPPPAGWHTLENVR
jgi:hypothetical protein